MTPWTCTKCGECCRVTPYVTVTDDERAVLESRRGEIRLSWLPDDRPGYWRLLALPCPFYVEGQGCSVYDARPYNCRRYGSLNGYTGSERDGHRVRVLLQRRAQRWGDAHGWTADV